MKKSNFHFEIVLVVLVCTVGCGNSLVGTDVVGWDVSEDSGIPETGGTFECKREVDSCEGEDSCTEEQTGNLVSRALAIHHCIDGEAAAESCESVCRKDCDSWIHFGNPWDIETEGLSCPAFCDDLLENTLGFISKFVWDTDSKECWVYQSTVQFRRLDFVSSMPAHRESDGTYTRQCMADPARPADSLLLFFSFDGTEGQTDTVSEHEKDKDFSLRPGDVVKNPDNGRRYRIRLADSDGSEGLAATDLEVKIQCLESYLDSDLASDISQCDKPQAIVGPPAKFDYRPNFPEGAVRVDVDDKDAIAVAIMIDQSGSMKGYVEQESFVEVSANSRVSRSGFADRATDSFAFRTIAPQILMKQLNFNDRGGVFLFGEAVGSDGAKIVCSDGQTSDNEDENRQNCFVSDSSPLDSVESARLAAEADGRTPLWQSVLDVYNFMKASGVARVRHVFVITDGPDTCHPDSPDFVPLVAYRSTDGLYATETQGSCSNVSYEQFRDVVTADVLDDNGRPKPENQIPVHISFIQIQAHGYTAIDPLQQEAACLTGGHYMFINALDLPPSNQVVTGTHPLQIALSDAIYKLRYVISGVWTAAVDVADMKNGQLQAGAEIAVEGYVRSNPAAAADGLLPAMRADMKIGLEDGAFSIEKLDTRGNFRVPGTVDTDCSWLPVTDDECTNASCTTLTGVCQIVDVAFDSPCVGGTCIHGTCTATAE